MWVVHCAPCYYIYELMLLMLDLYCSKLHRAVLRVLHADPSMAVLLHSLLHVFNLSHACARSCRSPSICITLSFCADFPKGGFYCHNDMCSSSHCGSGFLRRQILFQLHAHMETICVSHPAHIAKMLHTAAGESSVGSVSFCIAICLH